MAVRATARFAQRVRGHPGSRRRALPAEPIRRVGPVRQALPAGQPDPGDHLADPHRLDDRPRRAGDGPVARHRDTVRDASPRTDGLGRRAHPAAHRALRERHRRAGDGLRAVVRLPPGQCELGVLGQWLWGSRSAREPRPGRAPDAAADHQPAHRAGGPPGAGAHAAERGRQRVRRVELFEASLAPDLRRGRRQDVDDQRVLAAMDQHRQLPGSPVAVVLATQRADPEGVGLLTDRSATGGEYHFAAGNPSGRTQLGLPLLLDSGLDVRTVGPLHPRPGSRGRRLLLVHRRCIRCERR